MLVASGGKIHVAGCESFGHAVLTGNIRHRHKVILKRALTRILPQDGAIYATQLEVCAAALAGGQYAPYMDIMGRLAYNLFENGPRVVSSSCISQLCLLSHERLQENTAHAKRAAEVEALVKRVLLHAEEEGTRFTNLAQNVKSSKALRCPKCKTQDGIFRAPAQLRCGDEGMDTLCFCTVATCRTKWIDRQ
jgi:DNA-directed RNA polymerase subunit M/transcription elongation factor TFIIS